MGLLNDITNLIAHHAEIAPPKKIAPSTSQADGRKLLGIQPRPADQPSRPVYQPQSTPTPSFSLPQSNLQMYGDPQGNRWMEDPNGNRFAVKQAPQAFDTQLNGSFHDPLRPGQTGRLPVGDATVHLPAPQRLNLRRL